MTKVSIIVPVYNAEAWIGRCIESVVGQSVADWELILVDDGSSDSSQDICRQLAKDDKRIRVISKKNGGVSSARNAGLDVARGEWIAFADSDDIVSPHWLEAFIEGARSGDPDIVIAGFEMIRIDGTRQNIGISGSGDMQSMFPTVWGMEMKGSLCNKLFKTSIIRRFEMRMDTSLRYREDEEFTLRYLSRCSKCVCINEPTYQYYEPDWSKYKSSDFTTSGQHLESSIYTSMKRLGAKTQLKAQGKSVTNRFLFNLKADKRNALTHTADYIRTVNVWNAFCLISRFILFKVKLIKNL